MDRLERYTGENLLQQEAESDVFSEGRYAQVAAHIQPSASILLDVGCSTGRGGVVLAGLRPDLQIWGIDVVQERLDLLPSAYTIAIRGLSTHLPLSDQSVDVVVAAEFLEHLLPQDVDPTLCEFQRVLKVGGRLILTTPNPEFVRLLWRHATVYVPGHLTQHHVAVMKMRLKMHGFKRVRTRGTGRMTRFLGSRTPVMPLYGSYLMRADKW